MRIAYMRFFSAVTHNRFAFRKATNEYTTLDDGTFNAGKRLIGSVLFEKTKAR